MTKIKGIGASLALCAATHAINADQLNGLDDFDDNFRDVAKWGATDSGLFNGVLTESNGRVEYSVSQSPSFVDFSVRTWRLNGGSYTNDWLTEVEINLPDLALFTERQGVQLTLGILVAGNPGHNAGVNVVHVREGGLTRRRFEGVVQRSGLAIPGTTARQDRTATLARVRLRFAAAEKVLILEHENEAVAGQWVAITSYDLDSPEIDWQLNDSSTFDVSLAGTSFSYRVVSADGAWFDDFVAASRPVIVTPPVSKLVTACEAASFSVSADAGPLATYQWRHEGIPLPGEMAPTLVVSELVEDRVGSYDVVVTNPAGSTTSATAMLVIVVADSAVSAWWQARATSGFNGRPSRIASPIRSRCKASPRSCLANGTILIRRTRQLAGDSMCWFPRPTAPRSSG